jgi:hypothetical protein
VTADGKWRVTTVSVDGNEYLRVKARGALGWIWRGDFRSPADMEQQLVIGELHEEKGNAG